MIVSAVLAVLIVSALVAIVLVVRLAIAGENQTPRNGP